MLLAKLLLLLNKSKMIFIKAVAKICITLYTIGITKHKWKNALVISINLEGSPASMMRHWTLCKDSFLILEFWQVQLPNTVATLSGQISFYPKDISHTHLYLLFNMVLQLLVCYTFILYCVTLIMCWIQNNDLASKGITKINILLCHSW